MSYPSFINHEYDSNPSSIIRPERVPSNPRNYNTIRIPEDSKDLSPPNRCVQEPNMGHNVNHRCHTMNDNGRGVVMSDVQKPKRRKFLNIDTRFTDEYTYPKNRFNAVESYTITLPERINEVKSIRVRSVEIPMSFYNFSAALGNSFFKCTNLSNYQYAMCIIPDGFYTNRTDLNIAINNQLGAGTIASSINTNQTFAIRGVNGHAVDVNFYVDICGNMDKYNFRSKMGWAMGFRDPSYCIMSGTGNTMLAESNININTIRYLYLVVDEFTSNFPNSFVAPMNQYLMNKKILARVCVDTTHFPYGSVLHGNEENGFIVSDHRRYQGKIDLQRLNIQLVTEWGTPVNLNGLDFSFILDIEHE